MLLLDEKDVVIEIHPTRRKQWEEEQQQTSSTTGTTSEDSSNPLKSITTPLSKINPFTDFNTPYKALVFPDTVEEIVYTSKVNSKKILCVNREIALKKLRTCQVNGSFPRTSVIGHSLTTWSSALLNSTSFSKHKEQQKLSLATKLVYTKGTI